jgi:uncharacterized protein YceH (UPF0502 family)
VLGCLVEKQLTTPQQYPLTLLALTAAVNQATNRDPVVALGEDDVLAALDECRSNHLVRVVLPSHGRSVKRYRHVLDEVYGLDPVRYGLLAALLLRGPQTVGELRARTERMVELASTGDVQAELVVLAEHADGLVRLLARRPGQKEDRWQQVLAGPWVPEIDAVEGPGGSPAANVGASDDGIRGNGPVDEDRGLDRPGDGDLVDPRDASPATAPDRSDELDELRREVAALRDAVATLAVDLDELRQGLGG